MMNRLYFWIIVAVCVICINRNYTPKPKTVVQEVKLAVDCKSFTVHVPGQPDYAELLDTDCQGFPNILTRGD